MGGTITKDHIRAFRTAAVPVVLCGTTDKQQLLPAVDINHEAAAFDAVNTLIRYGHRAIAMIRGCLQDDTNGIARFQGYKRSLAAANIEYQADWVQSGNYRYECG